MAEPRFRPVHCTAQQCCWECYQGFEARTLEIDILNAGVNIHAYISGCIDDNCPTADDAERLVELAHELQYLISKQWREMTRAPFLFASSAESSPAIDLDELFGS